MWVRIARGAVVAALVVLGLAVVGTFALARPLPRGAGGPGAEALAREVGAAVGAEGWARTGAVRFTFFGHHYLWDRERNLVRYEDRGGVVLTEGWRPLGRAFRDGVEVGGAYKDRRVRKAYESFVNDAFWAFAPFKLLDDGATRAEVDADGSGALLVSYGSGGVTPGDSYLWEIGADGVPIAWRMWVSVLPIRGLRAEWGDWVTLPTGARVATTRRLGPFTLRIEDVAGAEHLADLEPGGDPFAPMYR